MTVVRTWAMALTGIDGVPVEVEADLSSQTPGFDLIGLADRALNEATRRVQNACANQQLPLPRRRITINLQPASLPKRGAGFDVAIAVAALATELPVQRDSLAQTVHIGELGLDGVLRAVPGVLPAVHAAAQAGLARAVVPLSCKAEAELVGGIEVVAAHALVDVMRVHGLDVAASEEPPPNAVERVRQEAVPPDLADVVGQRDAVEALIVAAAGGHHMLLSGPPGAGKTMLAQRLPGLLPHLQDDAAVEVASVRSLSGEGIHALPRIAPFEAPHHSASMPALIGGGAGVIRPGAIARAAHGVLFLDEAAEFPRSVLDALRQPLESGSITIHRANAVVTYPARFQLLLATNPCPCGNWGVRGADCSCAPAAIRRYTQRISGPLLDRIDIECHMTRVTVTTGEACTSTREARARVEAARDRARVRLQATPWRTNAEVRGAWLRGAAKLHADATAPLDAALRRGGLSLRGYDRTLRLAWTLADLRGHDRPGLEDVGAALMLKRGTAS